ncbi:phosphatidylethanolamine-binding protein [Epithele typhae]|uniref:phosphatidylethanolamine-binding protein n=1 Tax=Epithele typhae TaxID=378194 RepID=UPI0020077008|nr:phosphatidylethanolamine-binding protein [Epithele typhae]KAH9916585.1 phosphatidylethanolamine-binding protein [Epithele typhae]
MLSLLLTAAALFALASAASVPAELQNVVLAFNHAQIVPDVIPRFAPTALLNVAFPDAATNASTNSTGDTLLAAQILRRPTVSLAPAGPALQNGTFLLAIIDPDVTPTDGGVPQYRHLLAPGLQLTGALSAAATGRAVPLANTSGVLTEYTPPSAPGGASPHRIVMLLYAQPDNFTMLDARTYVNSSTPASGFDIATFAARMGLGPPVAGAFFYLGLDPPASTASNTASATVTTTGSNTAASGSGTAAAGSHANGAVCARAGVLGVLVGVVLVMTALGPLGV